MISQLGIYLNVQVDVLEAKTGRILRREKTHNKVPQVGRHIVRDLLARGVPGTGDGFAPTHMAVGTGSAAPADGDTKLGTEVYRARLDTRQGSTNKVTFQLFIDTSSANGNTIAEAGLFDSSLTDAGSMLNRFTFTPIAKTASVEVVLTVEITIASS